MTDNNAAEFHPESTAIIEALIASAVDDLGVTAVDEEALAKFACGWITEEEYDLVICALSHSAFLRTRLLQMKGEIKAAEASVVERERVFEKNSVLAQVLITALRTSVGVFSNWGNVCRQLATSSQGNSDDDRSIRAALANLGKRLKASPAPAFATHRSGVQQSWVTLHPDLVPADLTVTWDDGEKLSARANFEMSFVEPKEVSLYLVEPDGGWAWLGSSLTHGKHWELETSGYKEMLDIADQPLNSLWFALAEGRWFGPRETISLSISSNLLTSSTVPFLRLRMIKPPVVFQGHFQVEVEIPEAVRATYAQATLNLAVEVGLTTFVLGSWRLDTLPSSNPVALVAPGLGLPDCEIEMVGAVRLYLR